MDVTEFSNQICNIVSILNTKVKYKIHKYIDHWLLIVYDGDDIGFQVSLFYSQNDLIDIVNKKFKEYISNQNLGIKYLDGCWSINDYYHCPVPFNKLHLYKPQLKLWKDLVWRLGEHQIEPHFYDDAIRFDFDYYNNRQVLIVKQDGFYISGEKYDGAVDELVAELEGASKTPVEIFIRAENNVYEAQTAVESALIRAGFVVEKVSILS